MAVAKRDEAKVSEICDSVLLRVRGGRCLRTVAACGVECRHQTSQPALPPDHIATATKYHSMSRLGRGLEICEVW